MEKFHTAASPRLASLLLAGLMLASGVPAGAAPPEAATPDAAHHEMHDHGGATQDNAALAKQYEAEAADAIAKAEQHEAMAQVYSRGGSPKTDNASIVHHCQRLAKDYRAAAEELRGLASALRQQTGG